MRFIIQSVAGRDCTALANQLREDGNINQVEVSQDPGWPAQPNPWRGFRAAIESVVGEGWVTVLQDDAVLCHNFHDRLATALFHFPEARARPLSLYANRRQVGDALAARRRTVTIRGWLNSIGVTYPVHLLPDLLQFGDAYRQEGGRVQHDDVRISAWADTRFGGMPCTVPCLVQHGAPTASTVGNNGARRRTRWFADDVEAEG